MIVYKSKDTWCYFSPFKHHKACSMLFTKSLYLHLVQEEALEKHVHYNVWSVLVGGSLLTFVGRDFMCGCEIVKHL